MTVLIEQQTFRKDRLHFLIAEVRIVLAVGCKFSKDRFLPVGPLHPENEQMIDISGEKMVLMADHPVRGEPHDFIIFKRDLVRPKQVYDLNEFPLATKDPKDSGVVRNGKKVTVRMTSQAPAFSLRSSASPSHSKSQPCCAASARSTSR